MQRGCAIVVVLMQFHRHRRSTTIVETFLTMPVVQSMDDHR
jgi:hypothetical protein